MKKLIIANIIALLILLTIIFIIPHRVVYAAEVVDKQIMVVDGKHCEFCLLVEYEFAPNNYHSEWICNK